MIKVSKILHTEPYILTCVFNNGKVKKLDIEPIINNQKHLQGIEQLLDKNVFSTVRVGSLGQIVWDNIITIHHNGKNTVWDYDISPEFAFQNSY